MSGRFHESSPAPRGGGADPRQCRCRDARRRRGQAGLRGPGATLPPGHPGHGGHRSPGGGHRRGRVAQLTVQVVGKKNARISDPDTDVFDLPSGGGTSELVFAAQALAAGPVRVLVVVRQGAVPLATLTLDATAVSKKQAASLPLATTTSASTHPGIDAPELEDLACLEHLRAQPRTARSSTTYSVRLDPGKPALTFESKPIKDREPTHRQDPRQRHQGLAGQRGRPARARAQAPGHRRQDVRRAVPGGHAGAPVEQPGQGARPPAVRRRAVRALGAGAPQASDRPAPARRPGSSPRPGWCAGSRELPGSAIRIRTGRRARCARRTWIPGSRCRGRSRSTPS